MPTTRPPCGICSARSDYTRFGAVSCRSCAEFYKRTVLAGRTFVCRNADGNASIARRKICESTLLPTSLVKHVKADFAGEDLLLCTWPFIMDCMKLCSGDYINFAAACFPEFAALTLEEQRVLLRNCSDRLYAVEKIWWTVKKFGSYLGPLYMGTLTTCFDSRNMAFFTEGLAPAVQIALVISIQIYTEQLNRAMGPMMHKSEFTDVEFATIIALSVWQIDPNQQVADSLVRLSRAMRQRLFEALEGYYREEQQLTDYSSRVCNILLFEQALQNVRGCDDQRSFDAFFNNI